MTTKLETLNIETTLDIPGLTFRHFRGDEDYPIMLDTFKASMNADALKAGDTLEDYINDYQHRPNFDHDKDILLVDVNGENVANGNCWWNQELSGAYRYSFWVNLRPEWRGQGIETHLTAYLMDRLAEIACQHPADAEKFYQIYTADTRKWQTTQLESLGFDAVRYIFRMSRSCKLPVKVLPLPEGIVVRQPTPEEYHKVWDADQEAFRDHWGMAEPTEERYQAWIKSSYFQPELWKVAWDGDEIAGMVLNFVDHAENKTYGRWHGYTEDISVRRPWRRRGIARALLTQSVKMFQEMGMEETALSVDAENLSGALKLYTDVGYQEYRRWMVYRKQMNKRTTNYGTGNTKHHLY